MTGGRRTLWAIAFVARLASDLLQCWPLILIAAFFLSPVGPHLRWEYAFREVYGDRVYLGCTYLGSRGFVTPAYGTLDGCPVIAWLDARETRP